MIFIKQERILRTSANSCLCVHIYIQERNVPWFTDAIFQEILQGIKPSLVEKIAECRQGVETASVLKNSVFQVAYYVDKADATSMQVLTQELAVKTEESQKVGQFAYTSLRLTKGVLILVAEPFDANNSIAIPPSLNVGFS